MTVLTDLTADVYQAAQIVSRERLGYANGAMVNSSEAVAAQGTKHKSLFAPAVEAVSISAGSTVPNSAQQNADSREVTINKLKGVPIVWTGEQIKAAGQTIRGSSGQSYETLLGAQIEEAVRAIANEIETDVHAEIMATASAPLYASGTGGTTPFASNLTAASDAVTLLDRVGAPAGGRVMVLGNSAVGKLIANSEYRADSQVTDDRTLRTGHLPDLFGCSVWQSHRVDAVKGPASTPAAALKIDLAAGYNPGDTDVKVDNTSGAIAANSYVLMAGNQYHVDTAKGATATALSLSGGLLTDVPNDTDVDAVAAHVRNVAFHRNAIEIAVRPPKAGNDMAIDELIFSDPQSQLVFRLAMYPGFMQHTLWVQALWGVKVWQKEHVIAILG